MGEVLVASLETSAFRDADVLREEGADRGGVATWRALWYAWTAAATAVESVACWAEGSVPG